MGMLAAMLVVSGAAVGGTVSAAASTATGFRAATPASCAPASAAPRSVAPPEVVPPNLLDITASSGVCGDRVIFEVSEAAAVGYQVSYERQLLGIGSGLPLDVAGHRVLVVNIDAPAYDENGNATYEVVDPTNLVDVSGLSSVEQVVWAGSLRGVTRVGIGVDRVRPYSVTVEAGRHTTELIVQIAP